MIKLELLLPLVVVFAACGGGPAKDPAAQLAALKDQKAQLEAQIVELEKQVAPPAKKVKVVSLSQIKTEPFRHYIDLQGKVDAEESVMVTAKMPGSLKKVYVKNGDNVRQGQLLAEVDDAVMLKSLAELEGQLKTAEDIFNRQKKRFGTKKSAPKCNLSKPKTAKNRWSAVFPP